jgi:hypothetical protein
MCKNVLFVINMSVTVVRTLAFTFIAKYKPLDFICVFPSGFSNA